MTGGQFLTFRELIDTAKKVFPDAAIEVRQISELGSAKTPYPKYEPTDISKAREEIIKGSGTQFDPEVVDAFLSVPQGVWERVKYETEEALRHYTIH